MATWLRVVSLLLIVLVGCNGKTLFCKHSFPYTNSIIVVHLYLCSLYFILYWIFTLYILHYIQVSWNNQKSLFSKHIFPDVFIHTLYCLMFLVVYIYKQMLCTRTAMPKIIQFQMHAGNVRFSNTLFLICIYICCID